MNLKNLSIGVQLRLAFAIVVFFVTLLGVVSYFQTSRIHQQTITLYEHPLQVRRAIGCLSSDILTIHGCIKDIFISTTGQELNDLSVMVTRKQNALEQLDILYSRYLGPKADIDSVKNAFLIWSGVNEELIRLKTMGKTSEAAQQARANGVSGTLAANLLSKLEIIDKFALQKGDSLSAQSERLMINLTRQLVLLVLLILVLSILSISLVLRNIKIPLTELTRVAREFQHGNMVERSTYSLRNEFGVLSNAFNDLADTIAAQFDLNKKVAAFADLLVSENEPQKFFSRIIAALAAHTGSQLSAVYLLSDDKKEFVHFESIGTANNARQAFAVDSLEGEFGLTLSLKTMQHIRTIPAETRFVFNTVSGSFVPSEIITIPILTGIEVVAIISLASLCPYDQHCITFLNTIHRTLTARIDSVLSYRKIRRFSDQLESQNRELVAQQSELAAQSIELTGQNRELEMQKQQLSEAGRLKTTFLSNMSHELRTPLNSVIALSGVLHRRVKNKLSADEYGYIEVIERNGKMLLGLINDILDIARIEAGREELDITPGNVDAILKDVVSMVIPQANQKGIDLQYLSPESGKPLYIETDIGKCRHILLNLLGNAVKFTEQGRIDVCAEQVGERVSIQVVDTGIGIAQEHQAHIFDEFRQADGSTARRYGGSGLGLAIAKKYAHLLGGTISFTSEKGKGSTFTLSLPTTKADAQKIPLSALALNPTLSIAPASGHVVAVDRATKTLLLVEDSEPAIIQMCDILETQGYTVIVTRNGSEALCAIEKSIPDGIILDLMMPGVDGFAVLKTVRNAERTDKVPVLILTAKHITKEELRFLTRNNIHQLIQKGDISRDQLLTAVGSMVCPSVATLTPARTSLPKIEGRPIVLVVEDNPDNMLTMRALLAEEYTMIEATNGAEGVASAKKYSPHLILMDIGLPEADGVESFKTIRNSPDTAHIPVIAVTASAMTSERETILAFGFDAYISKPIDAHQLRVCIGTVLYGK